jgi:hypothetical protein
VEKHLEVVIHDRRLRCLVISDSHAHLAFVMPDFCGSLSHSMSTSLFIWSLNKTLRCFVADLAISVELK